jgi:hypothetical protein
MELRIVHRAREILNNRFYDLLAHRIPLSPAVGSMVRLAGWVTCGTSIDQILPRSAVRSPVASRDPDDEDRRHGRSENLLAALEAKVGIGILNRSMS